MGNERSPGGVKDEVERLARALSDLPPRDGRFAALVLVDGLPRELCAAHYGVPLEAADVWLLRAVRRWAEQAGEAQPPEAPDALERRQARALGAALEGALPRGDPDVPGPAFSFSLRVRARATALRALLEEWERAAPPPSRWEKWIRIGVALALVALALLLSR
jgi:hypothetical protein